MNKKLGYKFSSIPLGLLGAIVMTVPAKADLYSNYMAGQKSTVVDRLDLWRGDTDRLDVATWKVGGRGGGKLRIKQWRSNSWESMLGRPALSSRQTDVNLEYKIYAPSHAWQFRWLGKLPGIQPVKPHFGGNAKDAVVWRSWSARLMWFGIRNRVVDGDDNSARPSAYLYTQDRETGSTGAHNRGSLEFRKNKWYTVDMDVKLNNHNSQGAPRRNGQVDLFIDGKLEKSVKDQIFVGRVPSGKSISESRIHQVAFHNYYGGNKNDPLMVPTVAQTFMFIDDVFVNKN